MKKIFIIFLLLIGLTGCYYSATVDVENWTDTTLYVEVDDKSAYISSFDNKEFDINWKWTPTYTVDLYATDGIDIVTATETLSDGDYFIWYLYYDYYYLGLNKNTKNKALKFKVEENMQ